MERGRVEDRNRIRATQLTNKLSAVAPGLLTAIAVVLVSLLLAEYLGDLFVTRLRMKSSPVSPFLIAIVIGIITRNSIRFPKHFESGFKFCASRLLRLGIVLLGIRLSLVAIASIGSVAVVVVVLCIGAGIAFVTLLARAFGVNDRLGTLIAAGTAICGVSAIVAIAPTIDAAEEETAYAISTITIFGFLATLTYPYLAELLLGLESAQAGIFLGTAVHDTSQVTGAALIYDQIWNREISSIAITTKLVRNTFLVAVIPILSVAHTRRSVGTRANMGSRTSWGSIMGCFPTFVLGFLALAIFRSIGDSSLHDGTGSFLIWQTAESWIRFHTTTGEIATYLLAVAIAAAGLNTQISKLKQLTAKPFMIGFMAAVLLGLVSFVLVHWLRAPIAALVVS